MILTLFDYSVIHVNRLIFLFYLFTLFFARKNKNDLYAKGVEHVLWYIFFY
jgi:hypothetical protein